MKFRKLGQSDLNCSVIGLGTWGMAGSFWGKVDDDQSIATIRAGLEAGINLIDTAPVYGDGHSEEVVGRALEGLKREDIVLATKCGRFTCETEKIRQELETSLKRLKTDYIDLYQVHWPDDKVPFEETFGELENMRKQGKIRYIGVSNFSVEQTEEASKYCQIVSTQPQYSLLVRDIEKDILPYCVEKNIGILSYGSIGAGALTGKFKEKPVFKEDDERASFYTFFQEQNWPKTKQMIDTLEEIAASHGKPTVHAAINWVLKQKGISVALVGARTPEQVRMNAQAADWELTDEENAKILQAYDRIFE
ncbi:MAG: aldo/keto reductase [Clostridiales bacterium]|jgi:aldo/keto reductase|nr:aldo/keto reductase [Clostridiales bacterium]MBS6941884.1 aldo/keto reductase [Clostridiales bacterium]